MATTNSTSNTAQTSAYSYLQYKNKIGGLVSGMDIDSLMEKLMKAESAQMEKLQQQKTKYEWQRDAYREVNTKLSTFEQNSFTDYGLKSSWNTKSVTVSSDAVSAKATSAANGTLNIEAAKLATAGYKKVDMPNDITENTTMQELGISGENNTFKIKALNDQGGYTEKTISYSASDKVSDVMTRINSSGVGVTAIVSDGQLSFTANVEGEGKVDDDGTKGSIRITADEKNLFKTIGVFDANESSTGIIATGTDGFIRVNGVDIKGTSNTYSVSGYQLNINKEFNSEVDANGNLIQTTPPTKITSTTDTDAIVDKVKKFVDSYNELIADLNKRTTEKKNVSYSPLTDAQKAEMTTDEIKKWEDKAKEGLLKGDSTLNKVISNLRTTLSTYGTTDKDGNPTTNNTDMLFKIGITTSAAYTDNGKLVIDEDKLKEALASDPDIVSRIFTGDSSTGAEGIISKMRTTVKDAVATIKNTAGGTDSTSDLTYSIGKTISSLTSKIDDWKDRLKDIEERYWNQFSAMEKAIQKANSQTSIFDSY